MKRKIILWGIASIILFSTSVRTEAESDWRENGSSTSVFEVSEENDSPSRYILTDMITATLYFEGGCAFCYGRVIPAGNQSTSITVTLYKRVGLTWTYIASWTASDTQGYGCQAGGSVAVGYGTYKVVSLGNVDDLEFPTATIQRNNPN